MNKKKMYIIDIIVFAVLLVADQVTKAFVLNGLKGKAAIPIIQDVFELCYVENRGSAFGMLQNQKVFLLFIGFVFLAVLIFFLIKLPAQKKFNAVHICMVAIMAGGLGNMIDRFRFDYVVDFLSFVLIHFPVFNFADCCIVVGVIILFILFIFVYKEQDLEFLDFKKKKYREIK